MANSLYSALVGVDANSWDDGDPVGVDAARALANNAAHHVDSGGRVIANHLPQTGVQPQSEKDLVDKQRYLMFATKFNASMRPNGNAFRYRWLMSGRVTTPDAGVAATFVLVIAPTMEIAEAHQRDTARANVGSFSTDSVTTVSDNGVINLPSDVVLGGLSRGRRITEDSSEITVTTVELVAAVFASVDSVTREPVLERVYLAEYMSP